MLENYEYLKLPFDLAGSRSKNRFRNEMLWGLKKIIELHEDDAPYTVVFDYSCDVEVHKDNNFEYYQLKTQNDNGGYKLDTILKQSKTGKSVLGKLYILKYDTCEKECDCIKLALVSNAPLDIGSKVYKSIDNIELLKLDNKTVEKIRTKLMEELNKDKVALNNSYYIRTGLDLNNPNATLIGEVSIFYEKKFNMEPPKINALYRLLSEEIAIKACYENEICDYDDLLSMKGISRNRVDILLNMFNENTEISYEKTKEQIEQRYGHSFRLRMGRLRSLAKIKIRFEKDKWLQNFEIKIRNFIIEKIDTLPEKDEEVVGFVISNFKDEIVIDFDVIDLEVLVYLIMMKMQEDTYEINDN